MLDHADSHPHEKGHAAPQGAAATAVFLLMAAAMNPFGFWFSRAHEAPNHKLPLHKK